MLHCAGHAACHCSPHALAPPPTHAGSSCSDDSSSGSEGNETDCGHALPPPLSEEEAAALLVDASGRPLASLEALTPRQRFPVAVRPCSASSLLSAGPGAPGSRPKQRSAVRGAQGGKLQPGEKQRLKTERMQVGAGRGTVEGYVFGLLPLHAS